MTEFLSPWRKYHLKNDWSIGSATIAVIGHGPWGSAVLASRACCWWIVPDTSHDRLLRDSCGIPAQDGIVQVCARVCAWAPCTPVLLSQKRHPVFLLYLVAPVYLFLRLFWFLFSATNYQSGFLGKAHLSTSLASQASWEFNSPFSIGHQTSQLIIGVRIVLLLC